MTRSDQQSDQRLDGRFALLGMLDEGAHGQVWRARDLATGDEVAVKILRPKSAASEEFLARFRRECRLLAELDHPGAVRILGTGQTPLGLPYVAMERVLGRTLSEMVERDGPIAPEPMAEYLAQIAAVLDAAHARGILHRDIKPSNIMVAREANRPPVVKVLDFGVAKIMGSDQVSATVVTTAGIAMGTPAYMSPEQAMGRPIEPASDIYSLGVTVFGALTGRLPFEGKNDLQTMLAHVRAEIPRFFERNPGSRVPVAVEAVVRRALAKGPADRPPSASEFARLFASAVADPNASRANEDHSNLGETTKSVPILDLGARGVTSAAEPRVPLFWVGTLLAVIVVGAALATYLA